MDTLKLGSNGSDVTRLQNKLIERGFNPGGTDGTFGPGTQAAVIAFQKSAGLTADGSVGPKTAAVLGLTESLPEPVLAIPGVTVAAVCQMFPATPRPNIVTHLPPVLDALVSMALGSKPMVLMALGTIRAETEAFLPISEGRSQFNTSPNGQPFDLYDNRKDLGNQGPPDGERFKGRGFIQLTGRANYASHGAKIGMGTQLIENPDLANQPEIAAKLLTSFLKDKESAINQALLAGNLAAARRLVNGGSHGLDRFSEAYKIGEQVILETTKNKQAAST